MHQIKKEIEERVLGAKLDKVYQPSREELILVFRGKGYSGKLLLSAQASAPRVHFTAESPENPMVPPMLCMLLRKRLESGKLIAVRQPELERALFLDFSCVNELGDTVTNTLAVEIMGRYSNIILVDENGKIVDAIKRVSAEMTTERLVLPGMRYELPPMQDKLSLLSAQPQEILDAVCAAKPSALHKALLSVLQGVSPLVCRELQALACNQETANTEMTAFQKERLLYYLKKTAETVKNGGVPVMVSDLQGKPIDYSFLPITQYGSGATVTQFETFSEMMDSFYAKRDLLERMRAKSHDLLQLLSNQTEKLARKISIQQAELQTCAQREELRINADLLNANLYRLEKGMPFAEVENYYDPEYKTVRIPLDPALTPSQNAQKYYKDYRRAQTAEQMLTEQIAQAETELAYLETVFDALSRATNERELAEIRQELAEQGYVRRSVDSRRKTPPLLGPMRFETSSGMTVFVGRNNRENDQLTLKQANKQDIWFHVKNIPGSHTILVTEGKEPDDQSLLEAAILAALHSKAAQSAQVPVDYTQVRNVHKPQGAKPGMVIYDHYQTIYVNPDEKLAERLKKK